MSLVSTDQNSLISFEMNQDMVIEILSHLPASVVGKFRLLNKECNKRTYDSSFLKLRLQRTNSVAGYFLEYHERLAARSAFVKVYGERPCGTEVSLDFLPPGRVKIKACDASHGILLCVNDYPVRGRGPEYIVCKPTTKQYLTIPKPKTRFPTTALGLMVIGSNPFRYKVVRLSQYNISVTLACEVFDSDSFSWKRLNNVGSAELPKEEFTIRVRNSNPIASYGVLHWLTTKNNVIRFCLKTDTCSFSPVPDNLASDTSLKLTTYEGKLGVISSRSKEGVDYEEIWVLSSSFGNSWVNVKEIKSLGLEPVGFLTSDVITLAYVDLLFLYNMKSQDYHIRGPKFYPPYNSTISYFPLNSDYERLEFKLRRLSTR